MLDDNKIKELIKTGLSVKLNDLFRHKYQSLHQHIALVLLKDVMREVEIEMRRGSSRVTINSLHGFNEQYRSFIIDALDLQGYRFEVINGDIVVKFDRPKEH